MNGGGRRKRYDKRSPLIFRAFDLEIPVVPVCDDVVRKRQSESGTVAGRLGGEEWLENAFADGLRHAHTVIGNSDLHGTIEPPRADAQRRDEVCLASLESLLVDRIKRVVGEVEQDAADFLRYELDGSGIRIVITFNRTREPGFFGAHTVIGKVDVFFNQRVQVRRSPCAGDATDVFHHPTHDPVGTLSVAADAVDVEPQVVDQFLYVL